MYKGDILLSCPESSWAVQVGLTYFVAWLMHDRGPVGAVIHGAVLRLSTYLLSTIDSQGRPSTSGAPVSTGEGNGYFGQGTNSAGWG